MTYPDLTTYGGKLRDFGYAGDQATMNPISTRNLTNEGAVAIGFGTAVARGSKDDTCKAPTADGDKIIGIAMRHTTRVYNASGVASFAKDDAVPILIDGDAWAVPAENVTRGDAVLSLTAGNGTLGGVTGGAAGAGRVAIPGATWETTTTSGQVGRIRMNG